MKVGIMFLICVACGMWCAGVGESFVDGDVLWWQIIVGVFSLVYMAWFLRYVYCKFHRKEMKK